jgi:Ni,Fe-hydrogenase III large subunit
MSRPPRLGEAGLTLQPVSPAEWHGAVSAAVEAGWRFAGLYAVDDGGAPALRLVLTHGARLSVLRCRTPDAQAPSVVDLVPAAEWDEREAHDLYGWRFAGHDPLRALVDHPEDPREWMVPVSGHDPHEVAVGPIHAGVIESGHFRFHVVGERILHLDLRLFYKHRGLERAAEGSAVAAGVRYAQRACAADAVTNAVAYAQACEAAGGHAPEPDLRRARTLLLELERLYNHLNDIAAICAGVGFAASNMLFAAFKERAQRLNRQVGGHRFLFDTVTVGQSALHVDASLAADLRKALAELRADFQRAWRELQFAGSAQERFIGVGRVSAQVARRLGAVGPTARAAGVGADRRVASPQLWYAGFTPARPLEPAGDVAARLEVRGAELYDTFDLLDELLTRPVLPGHTEQDGPAGRIGIGLVESPRGQTLCAVELEDDRVARLHLRTGSYANWPVLARAVRDELLPDFPLVNKSFELCYACVDR